MISAQRMAIMFTLMRNQRMYFAIWLFKPDSPFVGSSGMKIILSPYDKKGDPEWKQQLILSPLAGCIAAYAVSIMPQGTTTESFLKSL
jgi:hypothetical protein